MGVYTKYNYLKEMLQYALARDVSFILSHNSNVLSTNDFYFFINFSMPIYGWVCEAYAFTLLL